MKRHLYFVFLCTLLLAGCRPQQAGSTPVGGGMGMDSSMMSRHRAPIPASYAGLTSPVLATEQVLARGGDRYSALCASCHGDGGMGDGPAGQALDPSAAPIAHTSQMVGDDYLLWRISEGGASFGTAMPAWKETLSEDDIWALIVYVRALGQGQVVPRGPLGAVNDPKAQATQQAGMLDQAVTQGVITQSQADSFAAVHAALDGYLAANPGSGNAASRQEAGLEYLVESGVIRAEQGDTFQYVHDRLLESGLMR